MNPGWWRGCWMVWCHAVWYRRRDVPYVKLSAILLLVFSALLTVGHALAWRDLVRACQIGIGFPLAAALLLAWVSLIQGAVRQNSPVNARLVPGARRRVLHTVVLVWLVSLVGMLPVILFFNVNPVLGILVAVAFLTGFALTSGGRMEGMLVLQLYALGMVLRPYTGWNYQHMVAGGTGMLVALLLVLSAAVYTLYRLFPNGGERHWQVWKMHGGIGQSGVSVALSKQFNFSSGRLYAWLLRRDCRQPGARVPLLMHALGPAAHWSTLVPPLAGLLLAAVAGKLWLSQAPADTVQMVAQIGWMLAAPTVLLVLIDSHRCSRRVAERGGEQALLRLAPGAPATPRLNRALAAGLLRSGVLGWLLHAGVMAAILALAGAPPAAVGKLCAMYCAWLPLLAMPLADYASATASKTLRNAAPGLCAVLLLIALSLLTSMATGLPVWPLYAVGGPLLALLLVRWRWKAMLAAPVAFPAARLA